MYQINKILKKNSSDLIKSIPNHLKSSFRDIKIEKEIDANQIMNDIESNIEILNLRRIPKFISTYKNLIEVSQYTKKHSNLKKLFYI